MKKFIVLSLLLLVMAGAVVAVKFYDIADFKGNSLVNVSNITFTDATIQTTASNFNGDLSGGNLTAVGCIIYVSGGMDCSR